MADRNRERKNVAVIALEETDHFNGDSPAGRRQSRRKSTAGRESEADWILKKCKRRECVQYIPDKGHANLKCQCGRPKRKHDIIPSQQTVDTWDMNLHSKQLPTNAFGELEFVGHGSKRAKYIRVDVDTDMDDLLWLLMNIWGLEKPNILISVTGTLKDFYLNKRLREAFRRGLRKTILTTAPWIFMGGMHMGVMKHVGEVVKDCHVASASQRPAIAIGVAPWGCIKNRKQLETNYNDRVVRYRINHGQINHEVEAYLDPNFTHFVLVDDGTVGKFDTEIVFRANMERRFSERLSMMSTNVGWDVVSVPNVLLVLEGDLGSLNVAFEAIKNGIPAVVVKGSGGTADILAYAYLQPTDEDDERLQNKVIKVYGEDNIANNMEKVLQCIDKRELMSVFQLDSSISATDIDVTILQALLKVNKDQDMDQLKLALACNRIDVAKSDIFTYDKVWNTEDLHDVMVSAILMDRIDFVELFLDHGVSLREFLTADRLESLYKQIPSNCLLYRIIGIQSENSSLLDNVGKHIRELMGDYFKFTRYKPVNCRSRKYTLSTQLSQSEYPDSSDSESESTAADPTDLSDLRYDVNFGAEDLFIWSILMNRQDMAKLFWADGEDPVAAALVANALLGALKEHTEDMAIANSIQSNMDEWSGLAIAVLNECQAADESKTQDLLVRRLHNWGDTTCILIAVKAGNKDFIYQTACQHLLSQVWMGKMTPDNSYLMLCTCCVVPPLALIAIKYCADTDEINEQHAITTKVNGEEGRHANQNTSPYHDRRYAISRIKTRLYQFFTAPVITFIYNVLSYLFFLVLFSYVLIFDFQQTASSYEIVLYIWVFSIFTEEVRQAFFTSSYKLCTKLHNYISDSWNIVDMATIVLFLLGVVLRSLHYEGTLEAARVILAINSISFFHRLLHIFSLHRELGPKLVIIGRMMQDLLSFLTIVMVFLISYSVASHSILFPNAPLSWTTAQDVIHRSYWNIYGQLFLDEIEGDNDCTNNRTLWLNNTLPRCPSDAGKFIVPILMGVYMLLAHVLLLNLLIAMFSYTFDKVQGNTDKFWCFQRYTLIEEYCTRPFMCPPFILFGHIFILMKYISQIDSPGDTGEDAFDRELPNAQELVQWEKVTSDILRHKTDVEALRSSDYKISNTHDRVETLINRLDILLEQQHRYGVLSSSTSSTSIFRLNSLEEKVELLLSTVLDKKKKLVPTTNARIDSTEANQEKVDEN